MAHVRIPNKGQNCEAKKSDIAGGRVKFEIVLPGIIASNNILFFVQKTFQQGFQITLENIEYLHKKNYWKFLLILEPTLKVWLKSGK